MHHSVDSIMESVGVGMPEDITISLCMEAAAAGKRLAGAGTGAVKQKSELDIEGDIVVICKSHKVNENMGASPWPAAPRREGGRGLRVQRHPSQR